MARLTRDSLAQHLVDSAVTPATFVVTLADAGYDVVMVVLPWVVQQQMAKLGARLAGKDQDAQAEAAVASPAVILQRAIVDEDNVTPLFDSAALVDHWLNTLSGPDLSSVMEGLVHIQKASGLIPEGSDGPTLADLGKALSTPSPD